MGEEQRERVVGRAARGEGQRVLRKGAAKRRRYQMFESGAVQNSVHLVKRMLNDETILAASGLDTTRCGMLKFDDTDHTFPARAISSALPQLSNR